MMVAAPCACDNQAYKPEDWGRWSPDSSSGGSEAGKEGISPLELMALTPKQRRRTKSMLAGRARRQRESSLIHELRQTLPLTDDGQGRPLDKESVLRLAVCFMKLRSVLDWFGAPAGDSSSIAHAIASPFLGTGRRGGGEALGGGFIVVMSTDGVIIFTNGLTSAETIGKSIFEWVHPEDKADVNRLLLPTPSSSSSEEFARTELVRFKAPRHGGEYKLFQVSGKLFDPQEGAEFKSGGGPSGSSHGVGPFFVGLAQPHALLCTHPGDNGLPTGFVWSSEQIFTSFVTPDWRCATFSFAHSVPRDCQSAITRFTGFALHEAFSISCLEMIHPADAIQFSEVAKNVTTKGQGAGEFRCLRKSGGWVYMYTEVTAVDSSWHPTTGPATALVVRNHVLNIHDNGEIVSDVQLRFSQSQPRSLPAPIPCPPVSTSKEKVDKFSDQGPLNQVFQPLQMSASIPNDFSYLAALREEDGGGWDEYMQILDC